MGGACSTNGGEEERVQVVGGKGRGERRPLGRPRRRWMDSIKMDLVEVGGVMWTGLVWLKLETGGELL
jgi:hypothetical protein